MNSGSGHAADTCLRLLQGFVAALSLLQLVVLGMLPLEDGKQLILDSTGASRQAADWHCLRSGIQPFVGLMSQHEAETHTSCYHFRGSGCLDTFL